MAAENPVLNKSRKTPADERNDQRSSQYPPSKYASDLAFCSGESRAIYVRVAASGSMDPDAPLASRGGGASGTRAAASITAARGPWPPTMNEIYTLNKCAD